MREQNTIIKTLVITIWLIIAVVVIGFAGATDLQTETQIDNYQSNLITN